MEFKGTEKDWLIKEVLTNNGTFFSVLSESGESVCNVTTRDFERAKANALLIKKSREMLEKLICIVEKIYETDIQADVIDVDELEQLIKEATEL